MNANESEAKLGELARHDYWLQIRCHECNHFGTVDPNAIGRIWGTRKRLCDCTFSCTSCKGGTVTIKVVPGHVIRRKFSDAR